MEKEEEYDLTELCTCKSSYNYPHDCSSCGCDCNCHRIDYCGDHCPCHRKEIDKDIIIEGYRKDFIKMQEEITNLKKLIHNMTLNEELM